MAQIVAPAGVQKIEDVDQAFDQMARDVSTALDNPALPAYTVANLPRAKTANVLVVATNASTGRALCLSDGTKWLNIQTGLQVTV